MKEDILSKNLMILASAGSGKTYQLGNRVIGKVGAQGVDPERMVALTFTRKAAGEFADSVLSKLAEAATDEKERKGLFEGVGHEIDVEATLQKVVRALPRFQLGTMDGFFARVVRGFQYELGLTGGTFDLIQGPKLEAAVGDILSGLLLDALDGGEAEEFLHAFKRATMGREERRVADLLTDFFQEWQGLWKSGLHLHRMTEVFGDLPAVDTWEEQKRGLTASLRRTVSTIEWTRKGQDKAYEKLIDALEAHTVGSGSLGKAGKMFEGLCEWSLGTGPLVLKHYKEFVPGPAAEDAFRGLLECLRGCEMAAALERTLAVVSLVKRFDAECERRLRRKGMLGFDDVKQLMGDWVKNEEKRLRREIVDFRLDARYDHWLLDEFQDTSRAEWRGMEPLLNEAVSDADGSLFIVGDTKQAIYGWRGGDVSLFDDVRQRYEGDHDDALKVDSMRESWRSCEPVLDLVNQVCGNKQAIGELFGQGLAIRWPWENHEAAKAELTGEARVEVVAGKSEDRYDRVVTLLRELKVGELDLSCGVLVRTNAQLKAIAELLRSEGFDVIEEGSRKPTKDHPVGVVIHQLVAWLADPANRLAVGVLAMSPLQGLLVDRYEFVGARAWEQLLAQASSEGFAAMVEALLEPVWGELSEFGRRRAGDVIGALAAFDAAGGGSARDALRAITDLEIPQSPGSAAVQVMTVHKSKGLGFDVVILPEIDDAQVPNGGRFRISKGDGWILQNPSSWVREAYPEIVDAETKWEEEQRYEAMCVLYVALTRAKRGLYVLLPEDKKSRDETWASPANLVRRAIGGEAFVSGSDAWLDEIEQRVSPKQEGDLELVEPKPMRERSTPSGGKGKVDGEIADSPTGKRFGSEVHEIFEQVGWIDEGMPNLPPTEAGRLVEKVLEIPEVRQRFVKGGQEIALYREQAIEVLLNGRWMSGIVDRLHVFDGGRRIEIIDFKSDAVESPKVLAERYRGQLAAYREAVASIYPEAEIATLLLSMSLAEWLEV